MGRLLKIYLRPSSRTPVREASTARAIAGTGLEGDHAGKGKRQITLISRESWEAACAELGVELDPGSRRANLLVEGVDLASTLRGGRITVGEVEIEVAGETRPCGLMEDTRLGLKAALGPQCRGGVFGRVTRGGTLTPGDPVTAQAPAKKA